VAVAAMQPKIGQYSAKLRVRVYRHLFGLQRSNSRHPHSYV